MIHLILLRKIHIYLSVSRLRGRVVQAPVALCPCDRSAAEQYPFRLIGNSVFELDYTTSIYSEEEKNESQRSLPC